MIARLVLPEFRPDLTIASNALRVCENAFPAADGSYRPVRDIQTFTDALDEAFQGGVSAIASDGTGYLLVGTSSDVYELTGTTWNSLVTGLTITDRWRFVQFGDYVVAVNGAVTREIDLSSGTDSAISGAPTATSIAVIGDYIMVGQPNGDINKVRWCAFRDHTGWTNGVDQAGENPMQTGGAVQFIAGGEYGVILQRERIVRATRTGGSTAPFQFDEITSNFGCASGNTVAQAGRTVFFYSDRGFMAIEDGQMLRPIGSEKVDRTFEETVGRDNFGTVYTAVDPQNKLVMWGLPGQPGLLWIYNFELDRWSTASFPFTGFMPGFTTSTTLEELSAVETDLDAMTVSLDDGRYSGGAPRLYFFDEDDKAGTLTGDTLAAQFDLGFGELLQGQRARIRGVRPVTDATENVTIVLDAKLRLGDTQSLTSSGDLLSSGTVPIRTSGRYVSASLRIGAGTTWTYAQGLEFDLQPGGTR